MTEAAEDYVKKYYGQYPNEGMPLNVMEELVFLVNDANGWFDSNRTFGDDMALLHSEVSEAFEAFRKHNIEDITVKLCVDKNYNSTLLPHDTDLVNNNHTCKPEGVGSELADVLVRLLDTCRRYNINLEYEFHRKMKYNATRGYRHGNRIV